MIVQDYKTEDIAPSTIAPREIAPRVEMEDTRPLDAELSMNDELVGATY